MADLQTIEKHAVIRSLWFGDHQDGGYPDACSELFSADIMEQAQEEIVTWPGYAPTELRRLDFLERETGVARLDYKDESSRFGLGSFKALGGAYAVLHYLAEHLGQLLGKPVSIADLRSGKYRQEAARVTVATATDGNHGRSVAWGAQMAGCSCRIYIHKEVSEGREAAMAAFGADVIRIDGDYDESVRLAAAEAEANGWQIISDTSYEGYMDIPRQVMAGYTLMVREILDALAEPPTHVIVQAGVGGLAAAVCAAFWHELGDKRPRMIIAESELAACIIESLREGGPRSVPIEAETVMAGLSCGEISLIAWEILSRGVCGALTLTDDGVAPAMRLMADHEIEAGECAVPGILALIALLANQQACEHLDLGPDSRVLVFGCEGATDPEVYRSMLEEDDRG